jgi:copper chaperone CopZ
MLIEIDGMHCGGCVKRVRATLEKAGAKIDSVEIGKATVEGDAAAIVAALEKAGYPARVNAS